MREKILQIKTGMILPTFEDEYVPMQQAKKDNRFPAVLKVKGNTFKVKNASTKKEDE